MGKDDTIEIADPPTQRDDGVQGGREHLGRIAIPVDRIRIGIHLADVTQRDRAQHGVDHRMDQHIAVAVADQFPVVGNIDPTQSQRATGLKPMGIVANSNAWFVRGSISCQGSLGD